MTEPDTAPEVDTLPGALEPTEPEPTPPPVPPIFDPKLAPYAQWTTDEDKGARRAHDDARLPPSERQTPEDVATQGPAYLNGYNRHWTDLRDAGVIR